MLFLIGWTTVLIPKHASEALAICSSPREWPRRPDRLHDVFASLGMKSPDTMQLTAGCNSMMKQWRWSVAVLYVPIQKSVRMLLTKTHRALNTFVFFLIFFIGYLWIPFINVTAFAWQWLRRNSHRPVQRSPKVSLPLEKRNPASGDASVKHQRFSFESIRSKLSQNLHYADVADSYRETTLSDIPSEHVPTLRLETCEPGSKTQCWSCGNQICKSCTVKAKTPMPESTQHLQHCLPYCSRCHFIFLCSRGEKDIENTGKGCNIPEHAANQSTSARAKNVVTEEVRSLCRACGQLKREETTKVYERRELVETRRMARNLQCHACSRELNWSKSMGKQPRCWWRCDSCSSTCWWNKHMGIDG